jgi:hypothetical protein
MTAEGSAYGDDRASKKDELRKKLRELDEQWSDANRKVRELETTLERSSKGGGRGGYAPHPRTCFASLPEMDSVAGVAADAVRCHLLCRAVGR